jgi:hypothetical protein
MKFEAEDYKSEIHKSKFVFFKNKSKIKNPELTFAINPWGIERSFLGDKKKFYAKFEEKKNSLNLSIYCGDVKVKNWLAGYPSIILGQSPWWPSSKIKLKKVKEYKKMNVKIDWNMQARGFYNLTYDIWLSKNKNFSKKDHLEIMVWLERNFEPPWKEIGTFKNFKVKYKKKDVGEDKGGIVIAFFPNKKIKSFDIIELTKFCKNKIKKIENYQFKSIEIGSEFGPKSEIELKIKNIKYDFS